jgi:probable HAF family extracellular repeat protein
MPAMRAFLWTASGVKQLGILAGDQESEALGINEAGDIVGWSRGSGRTRAVMWSAGKIRELGALHGSKHTRARAINARGEVVGDSIIAHHSRAFLWTRDRGMRDLNDLIPASSSFVLEEALAINDRGHIVALGQEHSDHEVENDHATPVRVFLLVPEH